MLKKHVTNEFNKKNGTVIIPEQVASIMNHLRDF